VLYDGKDAYTLSDQQAPEKFAGQRVTVVGTLDATTKTIQVDSIAAAR
jgi:starvation-inducible outer membrane lipoprotein